MKLFTKLTMTIFLLGIFSQVSAKQMYVFQTGEIKANNTQIKVFLGTPVEVLKDVDEKNSEVSLQGYKFDNKLYSSKNKALEIAVLPKDVKVKKLKDEKVEVVGVIAKENLTEDGKEAWEEHEEFYYEMCTQCHAAHKFKEHTMLEWDAIFGTMKGFAQLDEEESEYLIRFLKSNASNGLYPNSKE